MRETRELYIHTPAGDSMLVEIYENAGSVSITIGGRPMEIEKESAFELADAILMVANDASFYEEL